MAGRHEAQRGEQGPAPACTRARKTGRRTARNAPGGMRPTALGAAVSKPVRPMSKLTNSRARSQLRTSCSAVPGIRNSKCAVPSVCSRERNSRMWTRKGLPSGAPGCTQASWTAPPTKPAGLGIGRLLVAHGIGPAAVPARHSRKRRPRPVELQQLLPDRTRVGVREDEVHGIRRVLEVRGGVGPEGQRLAARDDVLERRRGPRGASHAWPAAAARLSRPARIRERVNLRIVVLLSGRRKRARTRSHGGRQVIKEATKRSRYRFSSGYGAIGRSCGNVRSEPDRSGRWIFS